MENKRYIHLSKKKIRSLKDREQNKIPGNLPKGLWIAKEKKWIDFLDKNMSKDIYGNIYKVNLNSQVVKSLKEKNENKILKIGTMNSLEKFNDKYGKDNKIDWATVGKHFNGIIFDPYYKDVDPVKYKWYLTLYIPSGCIWNKNAMNIELLYENSKPTKKVRFIVENKNLDKLLLS